MIHIAYWTTWQKTYAMGLIVTVLAVMCYRLDILPLQKKLAFEIEKTHTLQENIKPLSQSLQRLDILSQQYTDIKRNHEGVLGYGTHDLLSLIKTSAEQQSLGITTIRALETVQKDGLVQAPVQIELLGTYHQVAAFLSALANSDQMLAINELSLTAGENGQSIFQLTVTGYSESA